MIAQKTIQIKNRIENTEVSKILKELKNQDLSKKTCLPTIEGNLFILISEISHFKSDDIYCRLYAKNGDIHFITKPLKWVEHKISGFGFFRIHKSYFINIQNIHKYHRCDGGYLEMDNGSSVSISRSKKADIHCILDSL